MGIYMAIAILIILTILFFRPKVTIDLIEQIKRFNQKSAQKAKAEMVKEDSVDFFVFFGSQTGTSESFANDLKNEAAKYGFKAKITDLEEFNEKEILSAKCAVFLMSTHGEGNPTDSSEQFWEWFNSLNSDDTILSEMDFAVFGLGNSTYEFYNAMGKRTFRKLKELKAKPICNLGLGDDDGDTERDFEKWKKTFWDSLSKTLKKPSDFTQTVNPKNAKNPVNFEIRFLNESHGLRNSTPTDTDRKHCCETLPVALNKSISADHRKWHMEIDISASKSIITYDAGDTFCIAPENDTRLVEWVCQRFKWDEDAFFKVLPLNDQKLNNNLSPFYRPMTIRNALLWYIDLTREPKNSFLQKMVPFIESPAEAAEAERLLGEKDCGFESLKALFSRFASISMPFDAFLEVSSRLLLREYTVSSSIESDPAVISITYSTIEPDIGPEGAGVCTRYLKSLNPGSDKVMAFLKKSEINLPSNIESCPVLMIGAGTGVAPFRGFIRKGNRLLEQGKKLQKWALFFGCRHPNNDYIYQTEFESAFKDEKKCLSDLFVAFSRKTATKEYVQDLIEANSKTVWEIVKNTEAHIFICGSTQMGRDVKNSLRKAIAAEIGGDDKDRVYRAGALMADMKKGNRIVSELWG